MDDMSPNPARTAATLALAVADAGWFTTQNLLAELRDPTVACLELTCLDYVNAWRRDRNVLRWGKPLRQETPDRWRRDLVLPPGWMKRYPRIGMRPIAAAIRRWHRRYVQESPLALMMTYPHYLHLHDLLKPDLTLYLNLDDYALYWPARADEVRALELRTVAAADVTFCVARRRCDELKAAVPEAAERIVHLPHGCPSMFLEPEPWATPAPPPDDLARLPRPILGYIGSMEDRVDWEILDALAARFPKSSIVLIGRIPADADFPGFRDLLARPNVHALGWRDQRILGHYYRAFDVVLIPYRVDHPFNQACCPTKLLDAMGSGRPIVATSLPECRLYEDLMDLADDAGSFGDRVASILARGSDDGRAAARHAWAADHTCGRMAERLLAALPSDRRRWQRPTGGLHSPA